DIHEASLVLQQRVRKVYLDAAAQDASLRVVDCSDATGAMDSPDAIFSKISLALTQILDPDAKKK
ncbi:MAG: thymidylate kinase, partial [Alistipes sp.]